MIVVKVELWPGGSESGKQDLGTAYIANDGTGDLQTGNYTVRLMKWNGGGVWKRGKVEGFARLTFGPWDLLYLALRDTVGKRNRQQVSA